MPTCRSRPHLLAGACVAVTLLAACAGGPTPPVAGPAPSSTATTAAAPMTTSAPPPATALPPTTMPTTTTTVAPCPAPPTATTPPPPGLVDALAAGAAGIGGPGDAVSVVVRVEGYGEVLARDPDASLLPASVQKLLTAMAALEVLAPDQRFTTTVGHDPGGRAGAALTGDLVVVGGGDPTLGQAGLDALAADVAAAGLTTVAGDLVVDESRYGTERQAPGWQDFHVPRFVGPLSAFAVDDNRWRSDPAFLVDPAIGNGERLRDALARAGVAVAGGVRTGAAPGALTVLGAVGSPTVGELVADMLRRSDNEVAEALARESGLVAGADGTSAGAGPVLTDVLAAACITGPGSWGDGSGLSRGNRRSARELVAMLGAAEAAPWYPALLAGLPVAAESGTLANRFVGTPGAGVVQAKTGSILDGRALAGVAATAGGRAVTFAVVINGPGADAAVGAIDALVATVVADPS